MQEWRLFSYELFYGQNIKNHVFKPLLFEENAYSRKTEVVLKSPIQYNLFICIHTS